MDYWVEAFQRINDLDAAHGGTYLYQHNSENWSVSFQALDNALVLDICTETSSNFSLLFNNLHRSDISYHVFGENVPLFAGMFYRRVRIEIATQANWDVITEKLQRVIPNFDEVCVACPQIMFELPVDHANEDETMSESYEEQSYSLG